jgi:hypothetical protein
MLDIRWDENQPARWSDQIGAPVRQPVDVIVAGTTADSQSSHRRTGCRRFSARATGNSPGKAAS